MSTKINEMKERFLDNLISLARYWITEIIGQNLLTQETSMQYNAGEQICLRLKLFSREEMD